MTTEKRTRTHPTLLEKITALNFEDKVFILKELKGQITQELAAREQSAKAAAELAQGI